MAANERPIGVDEAQHSANRYLVVTCLDRDLSRIKLGPRRPSTRHPVVDVEIVSAHPGDEKMDPLPVSGLLFGRDARVSDQLAQTMPQLVPKASMTSLFNQKLLAHSYGNRGVPESRVNGLANSGVFGTSHIHTDMRHRKQAPPCRLRILPGQR